MKETTHLRRAHYEAMNEMGYSDEDIEKDWAIFVEEYRKYIDDTCGVLGLPSWPGNDYRPFGSSVRTKRLDSKFEWF